MRISQQLTESELAYFRAKSDLRAWWVLLVNWAMIAAAFALVAWNANPVSVVIALIVLGGRQLGLAVLMHDCAHRALFRTQKLNQIVGQWLCAWPVLTDVNAYRQYHLKHHGSAGTDADPDRSNYRPYPVGKASFTRKVLRDLSGITGVKLLVLITKMNMGLIAYQLSYAEERLEQQHDSWPQLIVRGLRNLAGPLLMNALLAAALWSAGQPRLYLLWVVAYLTTYMLFSRLRNAAEHAVTPNSNDADPLHNTRTTYANWWERLTVAPNHVNYHLEHHLMPSVAPYRLRAFHEHLRAKGLTAGAEVVAGYTAVIRKLAAAPALT